MKKIIPVFIIFLFFTTTSVFSQTSENTEEITVLKKANPKINSENVATNNTVITTEKMKNPNKKSEKEETEKEAIIPTNQKQKNPKSK